MTSLRILHIFGYVISQTLSNPTKETCFGDNQACVANENLIEAYPGVTNIEECKKLCTDNAECQVITHFGPDNYPFRNMCMIFRNCSKQTTCKDCRTEAKTCFQNCNVKLDGPVTDNLGIITNVAEESDCLLSCEKNPSCKFYTYYTARDRSNPKLCVLLSDIVGPVQPCYNCHTGFPACKNIHADACHFKVEDSETSVKGYKFTNTSEVANVYFPAELLFPSCQVTILAMGGGGEGYSIHGGGGGCITTAVLLFLPSKHLRVNVGAGGKESSVSTIQPAKAAHGRRIYNLNIPYPIIQTDRSSSLASGAQCSTQENYTGHQSLQVCPAPLLARAPAGARSSNGGTFSPNCGTDGGSAGGILGTYKDPSGRGSVVNISNITLEHFQLTPGAAGTGNGSYGGGGGGLLVDGEGPQTFSSLFDGQGYGGGKSVAGDSAHPGIVIIEVKPMP